MEEVKHVLKSRTVWGAVVSLVCTLLAVFGYGVADAAQQKVVESLVIVGGAVGALLTVWGRIKAKSALQVRKPPNAAKLIVFAIVMPLALQACALSSLQPHERGLAVGHEMMMGWMALYQEYNALHKSLPPEGMVFLKDNVAPALDTAKHAIIVYRDAATLYARTHVEPGNWDALIKDVEAAMADCQRLLAQANRYLKGGKP